jgi:hypothetical protein
MMKNLTYLAASVGTTITLLMPVAVRAQSTVVQSWPQQGYSSTTIYVPTQQTTTTTTTTIVSPSLYPSNESYIQTDSNYRGGYYRQRSRQSSQPTVIIVQPSINNYPPATRSRCTTSIIGSPIPSPIALDRFTGQPCQ